MTISVIIPVLNEETTIEKTLSGLQLQKEYFQEIIVVDGGSTDDTRQIAGRYATVCQSTKGRSNQMNYGATIAKGAILLFSHADSILSPNAGKSINTLFKDKEVIGGGFLAKMDSDRLLFKASTMIINLRTRFTKIPYGDQGIFVRREIFERMGGFRNLPLFEEIDFCRRLKKTGNVIILEGRTLMSVRRYEKEGILKRILKNWWLTFLYLLGVSPKKLKRGYKDIR